MIIALDYDGTYTEDPSLWAWFVVRAESAGHTVKIVTARFPHEEVPRLGIDVVYTSRSPKVAFCKEHGIHIDVWIDNEPHWLTGHG